MTDYVLATYSKTQGNGEFTSGDLGADPITAIDAPADSLIAFGVFDDLSGFNTLPRNLHDMHDFKVAREQILLKHDVGSAAVSLDVSGDFTAATLRGGSLGDRFTISAGSAGAVDMSGEGGADTLTGGAGLTTLYGGTGDDLLTAGSGTASLTGGLGADTLVGGAGDDLLIGGKGNDRVDGGAGMDTVDFGGAGHRLSVDLEAVGVNARGDGADTLVGVECVYGSVSVNNQILGDEGANRLGGGFYRNDLEGRGGDDTLVAAGRRDHLDGGDGADTLIASGRTDVLTGGAGEDHFVFRNTSLQIDRITDFAKGDVIDLSPIDADATDGAANDAFHLVTGKLHNPGDALLDVHAQNGFTLLLLNTDADGKPEETIRIEGIVSPGDLVL